MSKLVPFHAILIKLYIEHGIGCGFTVDRLPYTPQFENIYRSFVAYTRMPFTERDVWNELVGLRKKKLLPKKKKDLPLFEEAK